MLSSLKRMSMLAEPTIDHLPSTITLFVWIIVAWYS